MAKKSDKVGLTVKLGEGLKADLIALALERRINFNDSTTKILGQHFGVEHGPTGIAGQPPGLSDDICLDVPFELREAVNASLRSENNRRWRRDEPKINRSEFLNTIFRDYLDARRSVAA